MRNDHTDLNQLRSINLGVGALAGDGNESQKLVQSEPFNYNNTLLMRSRIDCDNQWWDLPALTSFTGTGFNCLYIGSVVVESHIWRIEWNRCTSPPVFPNHIWRLQFLLYVFHSIHKYSYCFRLTVWCIRTVIRHWRSEVDFFQKWILRCGFLNYYWVDCWK